jgi:dsRNA-specific ribonuclease
MVFIGSREADFQRMLRDTINKSNLRADLVDKLIQHERFQNTMHIVFTHPSVDKTNNYEFYEILGDSTLNKCVVWYISKRFPQLQCTEGVKIIARLKINLISKKTFSHLAQCLGFWDFISAEDETRQTKMKKVLEDVFEAFFGALEMLLDEIVYPGAGYPICYRIIVALFGKLTISLAYNDLYDPITRLKEIFDYFKDLGSFIFTSQKQDGIQYVNLCQKRHGDTIVIGSGSASLLDDAKQRACIQGIEYLRRKGFEKPIAEYYKNLVRSTSD